MTIVNAIIIGAIGSVVGAFLLLALQNFYFGWVSFPGIRKIIRASKEFSKSGGINFFSSRKSYMKFKDHGSPTDYLMRCEASIIYVGFWLAHGTNTGNVIETLANLLENKKKVTIVLLDPNSQLIYYMSDYLRVDLVEMNNKINYTLTELADMYNNLSSSAKEKLTVKLHDTPITASAFLLDNERENSGRTLVDFKLYNRSRDESFGMEFGKSGNELYDRITNSYIDIAQKANLYNISKHKIVS
ncbi:hypothetical protein [Lysinibacillus xylanilyticus]|uniref:hypothetical protein n=1 Tax=Lysinibacillus xylanilyticus TaxID=582475 RepID=UPI003CFD9A67